MKRKLVIIGNSSAAIECYWLAKALISSGQDMDIKGFLSFEGHPANLGDLLSLQIGIDDDYEIQENDVFAIGIGFPELRLKAYEKWKKKEAVFINLIDPACEFIGSPELGEANIFMGNVFVSSNTVIGNANYFSPNSIIGHDVNIGNANFIYPYVTILEHCKIGSANKFGIYSVMLPKTQLGSYNTIDEETYIKQNFGDNITLSAKSTIKTENQQSKISKSIDKAKSAKEIINSWEATTYASDIYVDYNNYLECAKKLDASQLENHLMELIDPNIESNINKALLFLNEYELEFGNKTHYFLETERRLENGYNKMLEKCGRSNCKLLDLSIKNINLQIKDFKNLHHGERCFIIGNGPSLNEIDLQKIKNEFTFGVNSIFLNFDKMGFQPTYYAVEDSHVIRERSTNIVKIDKSIKFIPQYAKNFIEYDQNTVYFNCICDYRRYTGFPLFSIDAERRLWCGGTVSYINLQLAAYMGFAEVYLIGFDHHYVIPESAIENNFDITSTQDDPNHFHPDYFGKGFSWHVPLVSRMELGYIKAKHFYDKMGIKIYNATPGGKLEIFPRVRYEKLFNF